MDKISFLHRPLLENSMVAMACSVEGSYSFSWRPYPLGEERISNSKGDMES